MKIALGTVQFGLKYGVANTQGQVSPGEAQAILAYAARQGIDTLDTAIDYGTSEKLLGEIGIDGWQVVSKLPSIPKSVVDVHAWVHDSVQGSLLRLKVPKLRGLLLHRSQDLLGLQGKDLYRALVSIKEQGVVEKIGVSIYAPAELDTLCPHFTFDLVQAPYNIVDRRIVTTGWLSRLSQSGVEIHTRSAFLQGLLLMKREERVAAFDRWQPLWDDWEQWLVGQDVSPLHACLGFPLSQPEISRVVVGVDSMRHLQEILSNAVAARVIPPATLACNDEDLINPSHWRLE